MIGISADFDPVHKGHVKLIDKARDISEKTGDKVAIYLNKGYSANHAPFFTSYEARREMALKAGADEVIPIEGLHHRLTLSYSVPIRIARMIEDGVVDYVDAANVSPAEIHKYSEKFVKQGIFVGIPRNLPNRNVIRWFAVNEFLYKKYNKKMNFHIIPELEFDGKVSGRDIRKAILDNDMEIPEYVKEFLPKTTIKILEREIKLGNIPGKRNLNDIEKRMNTYSRGNLEKIAYLTGNAINEIVKGRVYRDEESIWATFRRAEYGPVLTRLAISSIEEEVKKEEVLKLMKDYEAKGIIPPEQSINRVIERAWYVANQSGIPASEADKEFKSSKIKVDDVPLKLYAGLNLTKFESKIISDGLTGDLYINKDGKIAIEVKTDGKKIKTNLRLPAKEVTYLRYVMDSHFIPLHSKIIQSKKGYKVEISIQNS
ncbi:cytidyltransferase [Methanobrevibacter sp. DSM 116169]|uniref:cytidyltransferase n=1 Tax=Methanobrevibacter sp. DSM 116169 TaxID=3242727 RepID=UPI0038FCFDA8